MGLQLKCNKWLNTTTKEHIPKSPATESVLVEASSRFLGFLFRRLSWSGHPAEHLPGTHWDLVRMRSEEPLDDPPFIDVILPSVPFIVVVFDVIRTLEVILDVEELVAWRWISNWPLALDSWSSSSASKCCSCSGRRAKRLFWFACLFDDRDEAVDRAVERLDMIGIGQ